MNIGEASRRSGLPSKTIRYYEEVGLITPARSRNGYRDYRDPDIHKLRFLQRSRSLGFSIEDARRLLALYENDVRQSEEVHRQVARRVADIDRKIEELKTLKRALKSLTDRCPGESGPDCPILEEVGGGEASGPSASRL